MSAIMSNPDSVKILEITRVTPSFDSSKSTKEFSLPLTFFDIYWLKCRPTDLVYFHKLTHQSTLSTPSYFYLEIIPRLKQSLSLALVHHLPLAGNLKWTSDSPNPFISYTPNDGVSVTVAESEALNFNTLSNNDIQKANEMHPLLPKLKISDEVASIVSLQITLFPHHGFCIGMTCHHGVVDAKTLCMFMNSWAYLCKQGKNGNSSSPLPLELTPFFDRSIVKDPTQLDLLYVKDWISNTSKDLKIWNNVRSTTDDLVQATFDVSHKDIMNLREKVLTKLDNDNNKKQLNLSTFVLTVAYTVTCLVKARGGEANRPVSVVLVADCMTRLDPPLPTTYFGNCLMGCKDHAKARDFMNENGFLFAVNMYRNMVKRVTKGNILHGAEENVLRFFKKKPGIQFISISGSIRSDLEFYGSDFGFGKPKKVKIASIERDQGICMIESRDESGGVEVGVVLNKSEMQHFASLFYNGLEKGNIHKFPSNL